MADMADMAIDWDKYWLPCLEGHRDHMVVGFIATCAIGAYHH